jgi:hypothetical protein
MAEKYQLAVEAIIPVNRASGDDIGIIGNVHFFLEDILPHSLGKTAFRSSFRRALNRSSGQAAEPRSGKDYS